MPDGVTGVCRSSQGEGGERTLDRSPGHLRAHTLFPLTNTPHRESLLDLNMRIFGPRTWNKPMHMWRTCKIQTTWDLNRDTKSHNIYKSAWRHQTIKANGQTSFSSLEYFFLCGFQFCVTTSDRTQWMSWWQWVNPPCWSANRPADTLNPPSPGGRTEPTLTTGINASRWAMTPLTPWFNWLWYVCQ